MTLPLRTASDRDREFPYDLHRRPVRAVIEQTWGWDEAWQRTAFERAARLPDATASSLRIPPLL